MLHKCIVSWGFVTHIARPTFLWDMKTIKMIILMSPACYARKHTRLSLVGGETHDWVFARLVFANAVAIVMIVGIFMRTFNIVVVVVARAALVLGVRAAIRIQMLGFRPMYMAGLLGETFGRSLAVVSVSFFACLMLIAVARLDIVSGVAIAIALPTVVRSFVGDALELVMVTRLKLVAVITASGLADLVVAGAFHR